MEPATNIPIIVLAGGESRRFGSPKGLALLNGRRLIDIIIDQVQPQTTAPIIVNADPHGQYRDPRRTILPDPIPGGLGPLAGILAGLDWAERNEFPMIATVAVDTPFLPYNLLAKFEAEGAPAIATSAGRDHYVCGLWPVSLKADLAVFLESGQRAARHWAASCAARSVAFPPHAGGQDPFFNINTPEDLQTVSQG